MINSIKAEEMNAVNVHNDERGDPHLAEQIRLLLFFGGSLGNIGPTLTKLRDCRLNVKLTLFGVNIKITRYSLA